MASTVDSWVLAGLPRTAAGRTIAYGPIGFVVLVGLAAALRVWWAPRYQVLQLDDEGAVLPRGRFGLRSRRIAFAAIRSVTLARVWPLRSRRLMLMETRGLGLVCGEHWFPDEAELLDFVRELERRAADSDSTGRHAAALRERRAVANAANARTPVLTISCASLVLVCFGAQWWISSFDVPGLLWFGAAAPWLVIDGEWHRLLTAPLLHGGLLHALMNAAMIVSAGQMVERLLGTWRTAFVIWVAALAGSFAIMMIGDRFYVGASGAGFGLWGALAAVNVTDRNRLPFPYFLSGYMVALLVGVSILFELADDRIGTEIHVAGFGAGALAGWLVRPGIDLRSPAKPAPVLLKAVVVSMIGILGAALAAGAYATHTSTKLRVLQRSAAHFASHDGDRPLFEVLVHMLSTLPDVPRSAIEAWRPIMRERGASRGGESARFAADLEYRLGDLPRAIALQSLYMTSSDDDVGLATLAAMRAEAVAAGLIDPGRVGGVAGWTRDGVLTVSVRGDLDSGPKVALDDGYVIDVLVMEEGILRGTIRIVVGAEVGPALSRNDDLLSDRHAAARTELVAVALRPRVDGDHPRVTPTQNGWWYRPIAPGARLLPERIAD